MTFQLVKEIRPAVVNAGDFPSAGAYGWLTPYIAAIAAENDDFSDRALFLARDEQHFIALILTLMGDKRDDADHFACFAREIGVVSRRDLVARAAALGDLHAPPIVHCLPAKLAGNPWRMRSYERLVALANEANANKTLAHLPRITRWHLAAMAQLPAPYRTRGVLKVVKRREQLAQVVYAIDVVRHVRTDLDDQHIVKSLERTSGGNASEWMAKHFRRVPFPAAPVEAIVIDNVEAIRPLTSYNDIKRSAKEFNNCIRSYLLNVLNGVSYFYRYAPKADGDGVAIIELRRVPAIGWVVHEAYGPSNDGIKGSDRAAILEAFRAHGVGAAPQAVNPNRWMDIG